MEPLPPAPELNVDPREPCGDDQECSNEDYKGWWVQGNKLYDFLSRMPRHYAERVGLAESYDRLLSRWGAEVVPPNKLGTVVDDSVLGTLLLWTRQAETLIYYVTYQEQSTPTPGPTTPGRLEIQDTLNTDDQWQWPWIEGWNNPAIRESIVNPSAPKKWTAKRVLIVGAGVVGAVYVGKMILGGGSGGDL